MKPDENCISKFRKQAPMITMKIMAQTILGSLFFTGVLLAAETRTQSETRAKKAFAADAAWQQELTRLFGRVDPFFGVNADTKEPALLEASAFKDLPVDDDDYLFFDFGNNLVNGAVGPRGTIQRALIFTGIKRNPRVRPAGVWHERDRR